MALKNVGASVRARLLRMAQENTTASRVCWFDTSTSGFSIGCVAPSKALASHSRERFFSRFGSKTFLVPRATSICCGTTPRPPRRSPRVPYSVPHGRT
jgi:hypothetical protein